MKVAGKPKSVKKVRECLYLSEEAVELVEAVVQMCNNPKLRKSAVIDLILLQALNDPKFVLKVG